MMNWSCKCGREWQTVIPGENAEGFPDGSQSTLCDPCLDAMPSIKVSEIRVMQAREAKQRREAQERRERQKA